MKISALIPTYNRREHTLRAIESILSQTVPVGEIIVVDDGSTDGTADEIERRFGGRVRVTRQANGGVSSARRRAVSEATGDWIAFLDSDDVWTPGRTELFSKAIERAPGEVAWIFGNIQEVEDAGDGDALYAKHGLCVTEPLHVFADSLSVQHPFQFGLLQGSVIKREALLEVNCFSENLKHSEDYLLGIQIACRHGFAAIPEVVTKLYRTSDLTASSLNASPALRPDYYRARMMAFSLAVSTGKRQPWGELYADAVRGLCKELARNHQTIRGLPAQQFRFAISFRSVMFFGATVFGGGGLNFLRWLVGERRQDQIATKTA